MRPASDSNYLQEHRQTLASLFDALGEPMPQDDERLIRWMEQRWLGAEHGPGAEKPRYSSARVELAWPLLAQLGLVDRVDPIRTQYEEVVVMGAAGIGLYRRLGLVRDSAISARTVSVLGGQRPHSGLSRDGSLDEYLDAAGRFRAADGWSPPPALVHQHELLTRAGVEGLLAAQIAVPSETDMARLHLQKHWPNARLSSVVIDNGRQPVVNELGPRTFVWEYYQRPSAIESFRLLNSAPVQRNDGAGKNLPARPTSRSSIREWLDAWGENTPSSLLVVVNQPHLARVANDVHAEMGWAAGVAPTLEVVGCEVLKESVDVNLVLGEIPARINSELR